MDEFFKYGIYATSITHRVGSILLSYLATQQKIDEMLTIEWYDPSLNRFENKQNMKTLGGSAMSYGKFLKEMIVIALSKSIEDLLNDIEEDLSSPINFWNISVNPVYYNEMKMIRNMNNCIKHSSGIVKDNTEPSNRYLIDECGFEAGFPLEYFEMDYESIILKNFLFQFDLSSKLLDFNNPWSDTSDDNICDVKNHLIPPILNLS